MGGIHLDIVTPERQVWSGAASEVRVPGWLGEFGVLPDHASFLSLLRAGPLVVTEGGGETRFIVGRGFAEAGPDRVVILTEVCQAPEDVDKDAARTALAEAEQILDSADPLAGAYAAAEAKAELAQARLDA